MLESATGWASFFNGCSLIRTILLILGTVEPLAKGKLKELFPHYFKQ
jgi:hypothetical protein